MQARAAIWLVLATVEKDVIAAGQCAGTKLLIKNYRRVVLMNTYATKIQIKCPLQFAPDAIFQRTAPPASCSPERSDRMLYASAALDRPGLHRLLFKLRLYLLIFSPHWLGLKFLFFLLFHCLSLQRFFRFHWFSLNLLFGLPGLHKRFILLN